jgi:hypothetical protein
VAAAAGVASAAVLASVALASQRGAEDGADANGPQPTFHIRTDGPDGDSFVTAIDFGDGVLFRQFIHAARVTEFWHEGKAGSTRVVAGPRISSGSEPHRLGNADGDPGSVSEADERAFNAYLGAVFQSTNLNNFIDNDGSSPRFSFVLEFDRAVEDNDPGPDKYGEIIFFERGANTANSYLVVEAIDSGGEVLGNPVLIDPIEPVQCTPPAYVGVFKDDLTYAGWYQEMGAVSIDLSRLGVTKVERLRVRSARVGQDGLTQQMLATEGKDLNPDFKLVLVQTRDVAMPAWKLGD